MADNVKKIALIIGASSGIGAAFARLLAKKNHDLVLVARRKEKLENLASELEYQYKTKSIVITKDLTNKEAPNEIFEQLGKKSIEIDLLINNAGTQVYGLFQETDLSKGIEATAIKHYLFNISNKTCNPKVD